MEELVAKGSVKSIGISNFTITKTDKLLKTAKIVPAVNQGKITDNMITGKLNKQLMQVIVLVSLHALIHYYGMFLW